MPSGALVFADISGYTRFSRLHITSVLHAEAIISELLEAILQAANFPLQVGQLEGDAVLLYAAIPAGREAVATREIGQQIHQLFWAFSARARALIACEAGCLCTACNEIDTLKLKAIVHFDEFLLQTVQGVTEIAGPGVHTLRVLAKAPIQVREYVLLTETFYARSGAWHNQPANEQLTLPVGNTTLQAQVYYPQVAALAEQPHLAQATGLAVLVNRHSFGRMLGQRPRANYQHLRAESTNLVLYLLEGILSGLNVLRQRWQKQRLPASGASNLVARPTVLLLLQIAPVAAPPTEASFSASLLQAGLAEIQPPLVLNKLEGDAALLYALPAPTAAASAQLVLQQIHQLYARHCARQHAWDPANVAPPAACFHVILHYGEVAFKQIQQFNEIAGPEVILLHRLLKNTVTEAAYLLMTEAFYELLDDPTPLAAKAQTEIAESIGPVQVQVATLKP